MPQDNVEAKQEKKKQKTIGNFRAKGQNEVGVIGVGRYGAASGPDLPRVDVLFLDAPFFFDIFLYPSPPPPVPFFSFCFVIFCCFSLLFFFFVVSLQ